MIMITLQPLILPNKTSTAASAIQQKRIMKPIMTRLQSVAYVKLLALGLWETQQPGASWYGSAVQATAPELYYCLPAIDIADDVANVDGISPVFHRYLLSQHMG
jgi:hypothetical protein